MRLVVTHVRHPGVQVLEQRQADEADGEEDDEADEQGQQTTASLQLHCCQHCLVAGVVLQQEAILLVRRRLRNVRSCFLVTQASI